MKFHLTVERRVLAKRRWRGQAEDGTDFGFDLAIPLKNMVSVFTRKKIRITSSIKNLKQSLSCLL